MTIPEPMPDQALPPFSGDTTLCVKCSASGPYTYYRPATDRPAEFNGRMRRGPLPERLERQCARCDYAWDEALNPTTGIRPATRGDITAALHLAHIGWAPPLPPKQAEHIAVGLLTAFTIYVRPTAQEPPVLVMPLDLGANQ